MFLPSFCTTFQSLEVMCGAAVWSDGMASHGWWTRRVDVCISPDMDLRCPLLVDELERDLFSGMYKAFHVGTCCTTFSTACSQAYRSNEEPWGKQSETDPARRAKCQLGNYLALVSLRLIIAALASGTTIVTWENPLCSMMWLLPPIKDLLMSGKLFRI